MFALCGTSAIFMATSALCRVNCLQHRQCKETQPCYDSKEAERCKIVRKCIKSNPKWIVDQGRSSKPNQHPPPVSKGLQILRTPTAQLPPLKHQHKRPDPRIQRSRGRVGIAPEYGACTWKNFNCTIFLSVTVTSGLMIIKLKISIVLTISSWFYVHTVMYIHGFMYIQYAHTIVHTYNVHISQLPAIMHIQDTMLHLHP